MRPIRFRGRDLENGNQWRYGSLIQYPHGECAIVVTDSDVKELSYEVDPDTVGQYTGLNDINDTDIYEGDILQAQDGNNYKALWNEDEACFMCKGRPGFTFSLAYIIEYLDIAVTVIGNIHDNPDLMKGDDK